MARRGGKAAAGPRIEWMTLEACEQRFDPDNRKEHDVDLIATSIERRGFVAPPMVNEETGRLLYGHGRTKALRLLHDRDAKRVPERLRRDKQGRWLLPVLRGVSITNEDEARAYLVADNRLVELGGWRQDLASLLDSVRRTVGLEGVGYTDKQVDYMLQRAGQGAGPSLADRFGVPPFSVLDARQGYWRKRKQEWLGLGIRSELGRAARPQGASGAGKSAGRSFGDRYQGGDVWAGGAFQAPKGEIGYGAAELQRASGASVFDPVLCELAYRWFCPPGGSVLDPFAGGSVRGIVAGFLGLPYTGIDLRPEQCEANRRQWQEIARPVVPPEEHMPELTPIEEHGGLRVKRDDSWCVAGVRGGKVRTCWHLAQGAKGLVTAGSRQSPQANIVAHVAKALGVPCRLHTPSGELSPELQAARATGAEIVQHRPGHNSVIVKRAADDAAELGWVNVPFGMECQEAVEQTRRQVANVPEDTRRIVVAVGSGMSLAGVLWGLRDRGLLTPVLGVCVGADPTKRLNEYAPPGWREQVKLEKAPLDYHEEAPERWLGDLELDAIYEAKALPYLQPGDLFWAVGIRQQTGRRRAPEGAPEPRWLVGDSRHALHGLSTEYDFALTCPPYHDLEQYSEDPQDLSNMDWQTFLAAHAEIVQGTAARLREDRFACWVVGDVRDRAGCYRGFPAQVVLQLQAAGLRVYNHAVLVTPAGSLPYRVSRYFEQRKLGRTHQEVIVACKGDPARAVEALGSVRMADVGELAGES